MSQSTKKIKKTKIISILESVMPIFRINIVFAAGKRHRSYRRADGIELDTYYQYILRLAQKTRLRIVTFDVVQLSELSPEAKLMRDQNLKRMSPYVPPVYQRQGTVKRKRRL